MAAQLVNQYGDEIHSEVYSPMMGGFPYSSPLDSPYRGWRPELNVDQAKTLTAYRHRVMISDSRYVANTQGQVAGAVKKKADYAVGQAWSAHYHGKSERWKKLAEKLVDEWMVAPDMRGEPYSFSACLHVGSQCIDVDGDFFQILTQDEFGNPKVQYLEAHRIGSPEADGKIKKGDYAGKTMRNGIVYDDFMRPIAYCVLPNDDTLSRPDSWSYVPAHSVQHVFDARHFSQGRGIPSLINSILDWYDTGEIRDAEKVAIKANSTLAIIEKNATGTNPTLSKALLNFQQSSGGSVTGIGGIGPQIHMMEKGLIRYIKSGGDIQAHTADRPGASWEGFMDYVLRGAFSGMDLPIEFAWNFDGIGGAAVRSVVSQVDRSIKRRQSILMPMARSALLYFLSKKIESRELPFVADWHCWKFTMPGRYSVDVGRDAKNQLADYATGLGTLRDIKGEEGLDWEEMLEQRAKEFVCAQRIADENGIEVERILNPLATFGSQPAEDAGAAEDDPSTPTTSKKE